MDIDVVVMCPVICVVLCLCPLSLLVYVRNVWSRKDFGAGVVHSVEKRVRNSTIMDWTIIISRIVQC